jgi:tetratricopeptide (TPR) repeat protein
MKAVCYLYVKEYDKAIEESRYALELNNQIGIGYYILADALIFKNNLAQVIENLKKAIELEPKLLDMFKQDTDFAFLSIPKESTLSEFLKILEKKLNTLHTNIG